LPEVPELLVGDPVRLRQIIINLVGNAIKFTERGEVAVEVRVGDRVSGREGGGMSWPRNDLSPSLPDSHSPSRLSLHFTVRDTGLGIPLEKQRAIFAPFMQADSSTTRKYGGTGLGLTISSRLAEMMGGRIWVESEVGKGSTFHFTAQFSLPDGIAASSNPRQSATLQDVPTLVVDDNDEELSGLHILLAEDNAVNRKLAIRLLEKRGHTVVVAENGREVLAALEQHPFDVVLMDVQMPMMDGFEATTVIRNREKKNSEHLPIIAMTAHAMKGDRERCLEAGMDGYVSKPIQAKELFEAIARAVPANNEAEPIVVEHCS